MTIRNPRKLGLLSGGIALAAAALAAGPATKNPADCAGEKKQVASHIATFDTLDFDVFTHQKWDRLHESHAQDIVVHWPDGHQTKGIERHIEDLKAMFVYAPDTRIQVHPVKFGEGPWTSVIGVMEGTFTKPMPVGGGKTIPPTGKPFKLTMCTVGHWKNGVMDEEYLFWDNQTYMKDIGIGQ
jgi:SnoaL-like polyketide cyclase